MNSTESTTAKSTTVSLPELRKIAAATKAIRLLEHELKTMRGAEKSARKEIQEAAEAGPLTDEKVTRRIARASETLEVIKYRWPAAEKALKDRVAQLSALIKSADRKWSACVRVFQARLRNHILDNFPPAGLDIKALREDFSVILTEKDYDLNRAHAQLPDALPSSPYELQNIASQFVATVRGYAEILGVTIEEIEPESQP